MLLELENFKKELDANNIVVVDFYAVWCGPCKMFMPKFKELSEKYNNLKFFKINVEECPELTEEHKISNVPTFMVFKDKKVVFRGDFANLIKYLEELV